MSEFKEREADRDVAFEGQADSEQSRSLKARSYYCRRITFSNTSSLIFFSTIVQAQDFDRFEANSRFNPICPVSFLNSKGPVMAFLNNFSTQHDCIFIG